MAVGLLVSGVFLALAGYSMALRTHVQATSNAGALQWLLLGVLLASGHETWHLLLGEVNLSTAKGREVDVRDLDDWCQ